MTRAHAIPALILALVWLALPGCQTTPSPTDDAAEQAKKEHDVFVTRGENYLEENLLESALVVFNKALEKQERSYPAHMGIGEVHERRGDHEQAIGHFGTARDIRPDDFRANYKLALNQQLINRLHEAATNYLSALAVDPEDFEANLNLAVTYIQLGRPRLGLPYAEKAVELNSQSQPAHANLGTIYLGLGRNADAVASYEDALSLGELERPIQLNLSEAYVDARQYKKAARLLATLVKDQPDAWGYERLGYVHFKLGEYLKSESFYGESLKLDDTYLPALNGMGIAKMARYIDQGRRDAKLKEDAIRHWQKSIKQRPDQSRILDLIGRFQNL